MAGNLTTSMVPPYRRDTTYTAFAQYDVSLLPDRFRLTAGSKFEHNPYTGFEYQPQIRGVWTPARQHTFWAAVSRAVRTPPRIDVSLVDRITQINPSPPPSEFLLYTGNPHVKPEILYAFELGYRFAWKEKFWLDATAYYNDYRDLTGLSAPGAPIIHASPFFVDVPLNVTNVEGGQTHGLELLAKFSPVRRWNISTGITELRGNSAAGTGYPAVSNNPLHEANVQSRLDLTRWVNFDAAYYYNDAISKLLPPLNRVDVGLSTKPVRGFTFSLWGRNLQQAHHQEAIPQTYLGGEIPRSVEIKAIWESSEGRGKVAH